MSKDNPSLVGTARTVPPDSSSLGIKKMSSTKFYNKKRITIIIISIVAGVLYFLGYRYYSTGMIAITDITGAVIGLIMGFVIIFVIIRYANKDE